MKLQALSDRALVPNSSCTLTEIQMLVIIDVMVFLRLIDIEPRKWKMASLCLVEKKWKSPSLYKTFAHPRQPILAGNIWNISHPFPQIFIFIFFHCSPGYDNIEL